MNEQQSLIDKIWHDNRWLWFVPGLIVGFLIGLPVQLSGQPTGWFIEGVWPEALGVVFTVFIIDRLYRSREEQKRIKELKARLIREVSGQSNEAAKRAIDELRANSWLTGEDSLLKFAGLEGANLEDANLSRTNLESVRLSGANLERANLSGANLKDARLQRANLKGAILGFDSISLMLLVNGTNLEGAHLTKANLEGAGLEGVNLKGALLEIANLKSANMAYANLQYAKLRYANLKGADMAGANLEGANLEGADMAGAILGSVDMAGVYKQTAIFDESATLPDKNKWAPEVDMMQFTNTNHPKFWPADSIIFRDKT